MKDTFYFQHDYNAINDPKMMVLLASCGLPGVAMYRILIEILHQQEDSCISFEAYQQYIKFYTSFDANGTLFPNKIEQMLITCGLLLNIDGKITSKRVLKNKEKREELSEKRKIAGKISAEKRASKKETGTSVEQTGTSVEQNPTKERKGKEKKEKKIEEDNIQETSSNEEEKPLAFGNEQINNIIDLIKKYNSGIIDGTQKENRRYSKLLIEKLNKYESVVSGKFTAEQILETILQIISKNQRHSQKIVGPKKIYYELSALMQICKQDFEKEKEKKLKIGFIPGV